MSETTFKNDLPVARLHPWEQNPRATFDEKRMKELVQSVRDNGRVLVPVIVRPLVVAGSAKASADYEVVCGNRRLKAAKLVGLQVVPAVIRELTDKEALELALTELAQSEGVHPLEQAESLKRLQDMGSSTEELAQKMSKSVRWVQVQLQLTKLVKAAKTAFRDGKLSASVASLLARVPDEKVQTAALKRFTEASKFSPDDETGGVGYRAAVDILEREFMRQLKDAPFNKQDAALVEAAGACTACPKRSGAQPGLFDEKAPDVCLSPPCFQKKVEAHVSAVIADAKTRGQAVLTEDEAKKAFPYPDAPPVGFVSLDDVCYEDPKHRTFRKLLGKYPDFTLGVNPHTGKLHELLPARAVPKALKEAGHDFKKEKASEPRAKVAPEDAARQDAADALVYAVRVALVDRAAKQKPGLDFLKALGGFLVEGGYAPSEAIADARSYEETQQWVDGATEEDLRAVLFDVAIDSVCFATNEGELSPGLLALAKVYGIDVKDFAAKLKAEGLFKAGAA